MKPLGFANPSGIEWETFEMTEHRLSQIRELFEATLERDPGTRLEFLEQACLGDAELLAAISHKG
jgi:hypothetical protein